MQGPFHRDGLRPTSSTTAQTLGGAVNPVIHHGSHSGSGSHSGGGSHSGSASGTIVRPHPPDNCLLDGTCKPHPADNCYFTGT